MSGGGGGGGGGPIDPRTPCEDLVFETLLQSVRAVPARAIAVGDRLDVVKRGAAGPIVARHKRHGIVGSIISHVPELLRCLNDDYTFVADVLESKVPVIRVRVHAG